MLELAPSDVIRPLANPMPDSEERVFRPALERLFASLVMVDHSPTQMGAP